MIRYGDLLTFSYDDRDVRCKVEGISDDLSVITVIEQANTLRIGKPCRISIMRSDGMVSGVGVVADAKAWTGDGGRASGSGKLEYTINITKPFQKEQKRNAVRFECFVPAAVFELNTKEIYKGHILDISAGGTKILTNNQFVANKVINIVATLGTKELHLFGVILGIDEVENAVYKYQMRVKFTEISKKDEEEIVKFIFSEYRKTAFNRAEGKKRT